MSTNCKKDNLAVISNTLAPVKLEPYSESELADEVLFGMVVRIKKNIGNGWYLVRTHYGYEGYVHGCDMLMEPSFALEWEEKADCYIEHSIVDVMASPKYESFPIKLLTRGAVVQMTGKQDERWAEIVLPGNKKGWVRKEFVKKMVKLSPEKDEELLRKNLMSSALSYLGTQYRWGGKSPLGIDCSGLCSMAYLLNGFIIYRDAVLKEEYMRVIQKDEMKIGDLLFYPGHVAMYIGEDRFVHAAGKEGKVVVNSLNPVHDDYRHGFDHEFIGIGTIF